MKARSDSIATRSLALLSCIIGTDFVFNDRHGTDITTRPDQTGCEALILLDVRVPDGYHDTRVVHVPLAYEPGFPISPGPRCTG